MAAGVGRAERHRGARRGRALLDEPERTEGRVRDRERALAAVGCGGRVGPGSVEACVVRIAALEDEVARRASDHRGRGVDEEDLLRARACVPAGIGRREGDRLARCRREAALLDDTERGEGRVGERSERSARV